jgi:phosphoglucomutase
MGCEKIAEMWDASLFRSEVGEANVVGLAEDLRKEGYAVRISGEGSNGGNITYPSCVRDPLATIFSILKLLMFSQKNLSRCIGDLPKYLTTGVSDPMAKIQIGDLEHSVLKGNYQRVFLEKWKSDKEFFEDLGIYSFKAFTSNGKIERDITNEDFSVSDTGGFKIIFYDHSGCKKAFIWMRGSRTEKVFRVMCDVEGDKPDIHDELLQIHREMIEAACSLR